MSSAPQSMQTSSVSISPLAKDSYVSDSSMSRLVKESLRLYNLAKITVKQRRPARTDL